MKEYKIKHKGNGTIVAVEVQEGPEISLGSLLKDVEVMDETISLGNGEFGKVKVVASQGKIVTGIKVETLRWRIPLEQDEDGYKILSVNDESDDEDRDRAFELAMSTKLYLKDVYVFHIGGNDTASTIYISTNEYKLFRVNNIYNDGRVCHGEDSLPSIMSPREIISKLESSIGNRDLCTDEIKFESTYGDKGYIQKTVDGANIMSPFNNFFE